MGTTGPILARAARMLRNERTDGGATSLDARDLEEQRLVDRCLAGDVEAFRPLVNRYQRVCYSVALRMLGTRVDAEDVSQQAFVDAFNALDGFHAEGRARAFSTWLLRIVVNRSKDVLKSKKRTEEPLDDEAPVTEAVFAYDPPSPETNASRGERRHHLEAALLQVAPKYREVLILKDIEELSYEEIHDVLQLPLTTLKIRVVRARAMLRELIQREGVTS
ncbi:MAG TPA: sigma-70 family RNA polymerase sigma factor [Polyangia bacterium]|nr:sigma-70 family RNA polymerase sigma factor [Polyangia bacterium]